MEHSNQLPETATLEPGSQAWIDSLSKVDRNTWDGQELYFVAFGRCGTLTKSAGAAGIHRETVRRWETDDKFSFRQRIRDAQHAYQDYLENLALERVENPKGNTGGDTLLIALNNANNPEKWRGSTVTMELSDEMRDFMQRRQAEDSEARKALPEPEVIEHQPKDEPAPWVDE